MLDWVMPVSMADRLVNGKLASSELKGCFLSRLEIVRFAYETFLQNLRDQQHGKGPARRRAAVRAGRGEKMERVRLVVTERGDSASIFLPSFPLWCGKWPHSLPPSPHYD